MRRTLGSIDLVVFGVGVITAASGASSRPARRRRCGGGPGWMDGYGRISTFSVGWKPLFARAIGVYQERVPPLSPWHPTSLRLWMP